MIVVSSYHDYYHYYSHCMSLSAENPIYELIYYLYFIVVLLAAPVDEIC